MSRSLKALIACESSGTVRNAFLARGHDAWSVDLLRAEDGSNRHITGDVRDHLHEGWDLLMVAHPPCTRLCNSGVRWLTDPPGKLTATHYSAMQIHDYADMSREQRLAFMWSELDKGCDLFSDLWNAPIDRVAIENPVMHGHAKARIRHYVEPAQSVQPWQYGHPETKRTCFWLRNLPCLTPTNIVEGREQRVFNMSPGPNRWRERSRFFPGIADAIADQWGGYALEQERLAA
jgi:hypothetical protein